MKAETLIDAREKIVREKHWLEDEIDYYREKYRFTLVSFIAILIFLGLTYMANAVVIITAPPWPYYHDTPYNIDETGYRVIFAVIPAECFHGIDLYILSNDTGSTVLYTICQGLNVSGAQVDGYCDLGTFEEGSGYKYEIDYYCSETPETLRGSEYGWLYYNVEGTTTTTEETTTTTTTTINQCENRILVNNSGAWCNDISEADCNNYYSIQYAPEYGYRLRACSWQNDNICSSLGSQNFCGYGNEPNCIGNFSETCNITPEYIIIDDTYYQCEYYAETYNPFYPCILATTKTSSTTSTTVPEGYCSGRTLTDDCTQLSYEDCEHYYKHNPDPDGDHKCYENNGCNNGGDSCDIPDETTTTTTTPGTTTTIPFCPSYNDTGNDCEGLGYSACINSYAYDYEGQEYDLCEYYPLDGGCEWSYDECIISPTCSIVGCGSSCQDNCVTEYHANSCGLAGAVTCINGCASCGGTTTTFVVPTIPTNSSITNWNPIVNETDCSNYTSMIRTGDYAGQAMCAYSHGIGTPWVMGFLLLFVCGSVFKSTRNYGAVIVAGLLVMAATIEYLPLIYRIWAGAIIAVLLTLTLLSRIPEFRRGSGGGSPRRGRQWGNEYGDYGN